VGSTLPSSARKAPGFFCRFRCTMRVDCGQLDPGAVMRPVPGEWHPRNPLYRSVQLSLGTFLQIVLAGHCRGAA
jgi:hypothetical protein